MQRHVLHQNPRLCEINVGLQCPILFLRGAFVVQKTFFDGRICPSPGEGDQRRWSPKPPTGHRRQAPTESLVPGPRLSYSCELLASGLDLAAGAE